MKKEDNKPVKKNTEKLSESDLRELMGVNRDTYKKVSGVIKRK